MSVPRARLLSLTKEQCKLFATTYNPEQTRLGNKVLRQRLRGPALASYYPRKLVTIKDVNKEFGPSLATWDEVQEDRLVHLEGLKQRGKNAPKKKTAPPASDAKGAGKKKK